MEADDAVRLSRGMQGVAVRISRAVNHALSRKRGKVFSDRYHAHVLATARETRSAIAYLIHNFRRHMAQAGRPVSPDFIDQHSSAVYLVGLEENPLPSPQFWLLRHGYLIAGPLQVGRFHVRHVDIRGAIDL